MLLEPFPHNIFSKLCLQRFQRLVRACISAGKGIRTARVGALEGAISFVALEGDWSYFTSQNAVPAFPRPKTMLTAADYQRMLAESRESFPPPEQEASPPKPPAAPAVPGKAEAVPPVPPAPPAPPPPEANRAEKPPVPPPGPAGLSADTERRMVKLLQEELAQERTRLETVRRDLLNRLEQLEQKIKNAADPSEAEKLRRKLAQVKRELSAAGK